MAATPKGTVSTQQRLDLLDHVIGGALKAGADAADALIFDGTSLSASYRKGGLEDIERSEAQDLGLRVLIGQRQAVISSNDFSHQAIDPMVERVVAMAKLAPEDPYCGLAPRDRLARDILDLDLEDPLEPSSEQLIERAAIAEDAGLAVAGITNSDGANAGWGRSSVILATSDGFSGTYAATSHSVSCSLLAGEGMDMERDYDFSRTRHKADLGDPKAIGERAGKLAVRNLGPRKVATQNVAVVFDPRVSNSLVGHLAGAINGSSIARGTSFLLDQMDQEVFAPEVNIIDLPHRPRGLASKPFDGEGVANQRHELISNGRLTTWLLNSANAKQLGLETTGHAVRGTGGPPGCGATNLYMEKGTLSPQELIEDIEQGFFVTSLIGQGVNGLTGDYSRGASGFWIEKGEITYPVNEITIAGNLKDMFKNLTPANDLEFKYGTNCPTVRIEGMTIAGE